MRSLVLGMKYATLKKERRGYRRAVRSGNAWRTLYPPILTVKRQCRAKPHEDERRRRYREPDKFILYHLGHPKLGHPKKSNVTRAVAKATAQPLTFIIALSPTLFRQSILPPALTGPVKPNLWRSFSGIAGLQTDCLSVRGAQGTRRALRGNSNRTLRVFILCAIGHPRESRSLTPSHGSQTSGLS
jgi:hypothetical protein